MKKNIFILCMLFLGAISPIFAMQPGSNAKKRKLTTLGELRSDESSKYIKKTPFLSHTQYDEFHKDIVRLIRKAHKKEEFHKQTSKLLQTLQNFSQLYPTEYLGFLGVVSILHSLIKQETLNYPLIQYLFKQPKFLEIQLNVKDSNGYSLEECIKKRNDRKLGELFATATGKSNPIKDPEFENLLRRTLSLPCEEKIVCRWNWCSKEYATYSGHQEHMKEEHIEESEDNDSKCHCQWIKKNGALCGKPFSSKGNLVAHINKHTGKFKCDYSECNNSFSSYKKLTEHKRTHTGEKPYKCDHPGCGKAFTQKCNLKTHKKTHNGNREFESLCENKIVCRWNHCSKEYDTYPKYHDHFKEEHKPKRETKDNKFHCQWKNKNETPCNKAYPEISSLKAHINIHIGKYKCTYFGCNKACTNQYNLTTHIRSHTGEKPYKCDYPGCDKAFALKGNLKIHQKVHSRKKPVKHTQPVSNNTSHIPSVPCEDDVILPMIARVKPFQCNHPGCNKSFDKKRYLTTHKKTHSGKKPFKCDHPGCNKSFALKGNLTKHKKIHTGERALKCDYPSCNKSFDKKSNLTAHKRTHTKEKPFKCDHPGCGKAFTQKGNLQRHKLTHTFKCDHPGCGKSFAKESNLAIHKKTHINICDHPGCGKSFAKKDYLTKHKKIHQQKSICDVCGEAFRYLNKHKNRMHNK